MNQANDQCINAYMYLMLDGPINLPVNCIATILLLYMSHFLHLIYAILNASVILVRCKMRLERNETRGGNLLLGGSVYNNLLLQ